MMVDCRDFLDSYSDFRDGLLTTVVMNGFENHLRECESCARYDRVVGGGVQVIRSLPPLAPSPEFQTRLLDRLRFMDIQAGEHASGASMGLTLLICIAIGVSAWLPTLRPETDPVRLPPMVAHAPYHDLAPVLMRGAPVAAPSPPFTIQPAFYGQGLLLDQSAALTSLAYRSGDAFYIPR
jgi:hypothetical protein